MQQVVVGIDVSKKYIDAAFRTESGEFHSARFHGEPAKQYLEMEGTLKQMNFKPLKFVMEATGVYHLPLAYFLVKKGHKVYVDNALKFKRYAQMRLSRAKTDKSDARLIAEYGATQTIREFQPPSVNQTHLKQCVQAIEDLQQIKTDIISRIEALSIHPEPHKFLLDLWKQELINLKDKIKAVHKEMLELAERHKPETLDLLLSVPGIGPLTASAIIGQFGNFETFSNAGAVVAYVGLNPSPYQSGSSRYSHKGISKQGHAYIRRLLYMGAWMAKECNEPCKQIYSRLLLKHGSKKKALVAVAHKLIRQAFGVVKNGIAFEPDFADKNSPFT